MLDDATISSALWPHALEAFLTAQIKSYEEDWNESSEHYYSYIGLEAAFCVLRDRIGEWG